MNTKALDAVRNQMHLGMRAAMRLSLLLTLCCLSACASQSVQLLSDAGAVAPGCCAINGNVMDSDGHDIQAPPGTVTLSGGPLEKPLAGKFDRGGYFTFWNVKPGEHYKVTVRIKGFFPSSKVLRKMCPRSQALVAFNLIRKPSSRP